MRSEPAPAENGTIMRIDFSGYGCAHAGASAVAASNALKKRKR
jgi:NifU-like protein involved in Fe-S cluster formation